MQKSCARFKTSWTPRKAKISQNKMLICVLCDLTSHRPTQKFAANNLYFALLVCDQTLTAA